MGKDQIIFFGDTKMYLQADGTYKPKPPKVIKKQALLMKTAKLAPKEKAPLSLGASSVVVIGIDPGKKTGIGIYVDGQLIEVITTSIIEAIEKVKSFCGSNLMVYIEDARMASYARDKETFGPQQQGVGSVKRDCTIWEDEMIRCGIPHRMVRPNKASNQIAEDKEAWTMLTGYTKRNSEHARDAVMIARRFAQNQ